MNVQTPARPNALEFDYKAAARSILPRLAGTAASSVRMRRLDDDAAAALKESGLSRMLTPKNFGGFELSPSSNIWTSWAARSISMTILRHGRGWAVRRSSG